ncbi:MAG TPA: PhoPQ-activated protein PqaA family protein [Gemmata sp.]|nr:PhoPQ-activated protein PqaA family protein [Gemmata sp.]
MRYALCSIALCLATVPAFAAEPTELVDYVTKPDSSFSWKVADRTVTDLGTVYTLDLVSQTWHDIKWDHKLQVYVPKGVKPQATMVLWNQGGSPGLTSGLLGLEFAAKVNSPVAFLFGVPKQPLFGGKTEDALIAETFVRYLETKDGTWPLLFPMVKSIVRGMDALQAFAKEEWKHELNNFIIAGASKRGWTTWLTGATGDKRVKAIAPLVIDTLNIPVQMKNQIQAFGKPSEMIKDYVERKLIPIPQTEAAQRLWVIIDPWTYRDKITIPKMIVNGTNDPYWPLDALNSYWDGLKGDKWLLYVPNAGHDLTERNKDGKTDALPKRAMNTLAAFSRSQTYDKPMPKLDFAILSPPMVKGMDVSLLSNTKPLGAWMFSASSPTRDFRKSWWEQKPLDILGNNTGCKLDLPKNGYEAALIDLEFELEGLKYNLSTPLRILEPAK